MGDQLITAMVSVVLGIIGLAALATLLSPKAQTTQVIGAASKGLSMSIGAATNPYSGSSASLGLGSFGNGF